VAWSSAGIPSVGNLYTKGGSAMSVVAIIPARGGSKGVPGKNLRRVAGRSLVARAVDAATAASSIDRVFVSTDDPAIASEALAAGAEVIERPAAIAGDTASSEAAVLHALGTLAEAPEIVILIQATSPFIDPADLDAAVLRVAAGREDVVFAAVETCAFIWRTTTDGTEGSAASAGSGRPVPGDRRLLRHACDRPGPERPPVLRAGWDPGGRPGPRG
jgi:N-acylneuraminate cytidylyltransferase